MIRSALAKTGRRISRSSTSRLCAPSQTCSCSAPPTRSRRRKPGSFALNSRTSPSVIALSRQNLPIVRRAHTSENLSAAGGYVLRAPEGERDVTLFATGSEVSLAVEASERLALEGVRAAVVSMPCFELFAAAPAGIPQKRDRNGAAGRHRGGGASGLGYRALARRRLHRHVDIRRQRACRRTLQEVRHYGRRDRRRSPRPNPPTRERAKKTITLARRDDAAEIDRIDGG